MPIDLHQRLSEFSYGYGVTRQIERLLGDIGLEVTPFLPSLIHESEVGFDVAFDRPGIPLIVQFKLGEVLQRFVRDNPSNPPPPLQRPFWRFAVDTAEINGQFSVLLNSENSGAEVYYIAPKFSSWSDYAHLYSKDEVLEKSLLISPNSIEHSLASRGIPDGWHKIVYDTSRTYVCSDPVQVETRRPAESVARIQNAIIERKSPIGAQIEKVYDNLSARRSLRPFSDTLILPTEPELSPSFDALQRIRSNRLGEFRDRSRSNEDAVFAALGVETWAAGAQLFAVTS